MAAGLPNSVAAGGTNDGVLSRPLRMGDLPAVGGVSVRSNSPRKVFPLL